MIPWMGLILSRRRSARLRVPQFACRGQRIGAAKVHPFARRFGGKPKTSNMIGREGLSGVLPQFLVLLTVGYSTERMAKIGF